MNINNIKNAHSDLLNEFEALTKAYEEMINVTGIEWDSSEKVLENSKATIVSHKEIRWSNE